MLVVALAVLSLLLAACGGPARATSGTQATSGTRQPTVSTSSGYPVKVYFSKHPDSDRNSTAVFAVNRVAPNLQVATYAIQQLIAGPTAGESASGYFTPLTSSISGTSNCGGPDFQIILNMRGSTPEQGTATFRFCRMVVQAEGNGLIPSEITKTLTQFATIHKVVILDSSGRCYGDSSGVDICLGNSLVQVYFSKHPDSDTNLSAVSPVWRVAPNLQVATFVIQQLIAGPTAGESASGYYTTLSRALTGASNCGGPDFQITLNRKGKTPEQGTATLQFCRTVLLGGDLSGVPIRAEIEATLTQFATIHKVVILGPNGSCWDDLSGLNLCLR